MSANEKDAISSRRPHDDPSSPLKLHLHRRLHSSSLRHGGPFGLSKEHRHLRLSAKETVQSAIELKPLISFEGLLRRDKRTPETREQVTGSNDTKEALTGLDHQARSTDSYVSKVPSLQDVNSIKRKNGRRVILLHKAVEQAEQGAMLNIRQLDETFYSILEKASALRSVVASLQQLSSELHKARGQFEQDTAQLHDEMQSSLNANGDFEPQQSRIDTLIDRLRKSQAVCASLNARLEDARNRVAAYEQHRLQREQALRKRFGLAWMGLVLIIGLLIAAFMSKHKMSALETLRSVALTIGQVASPRLSLASSSQAGAHGDPILQSLFDDL